jgi:periplasmic divalent cation tolerance protein
MILMEDTYAIALTTVATQQYAGDLAHSIVSAGLAACVQIQSVRSVYHWQGEVRTEPECLLIIKTTDRQFPKLELHIKSNHSYQIPEIVKLPITGGSREYLAWLSESIGSPGMNQK